MRLLAILLFVPAWLATALLSVTDKSRHKAPEYQFTGIQKIIHWDSSTGPVAVQSETALHESGVLIRRGEFGRLTDRRLNEIRSVCQRVGMSLQQGISVRKQVMVTQTVQSSSRLHKKIRYLSSSFVAGKGILQLSMEVNHPPVSILRAILQQRVQKALPEMYCKSVVKSIIYEELEAEHLIQFLSETEQKELWQAKLADVVSYVDPVNNLAEQNAASGWEGVLYQFLDEQKVSYMTENCLREAGASRTPDCLLLDDCIINGQPVRWIDSKNFFGSGVKQAQYYRKSLKRQVAKYEREFGGPGAIIYRHGFSTSLVDTLPTTLLLDRGPLATSCRSESLVI